MRGSCLLVARIVLRLCAMMIRTWSCFGIASVHEGGVLAVLLNLPVPAAEALWNGQTALCMWSRDDACSELTVVSAASTGKCDPL